MFSRSQNCGTVGPEIEKFAGALSDCTSLADRFAVDFFCRHRISFHYKKKATPGEEGGPLLSDAPILAINSFLPNY
jgi:hypothetical protein